MLVSLGRLVTALTALITVRAVTTFLTPEQYGELTLLIALQTFISLFLINPVGLHINLHTPAWWDDGSLLARLKSYQRYVFVVSFIGGVLVLSISRIQTVEQSFWAVISMFAMVASNTWNVTLIPMLNMLGFRKASVSWAIISSAMSLIVSICLVMWLPSAIAWFAGQALGMGIGALGAKISLQNYGLQAKHSQGSLSLLNWHTILTYCFPLALATGLMWLQLSGYRFVIENYWGLAQLGFFAVGLQLAGQLFSLVESLVMQFLYPLFYQRVSAYENLVEVELAFSDLLNTLVPMYFVFTGLVILGTPYLLKVLVADQFQNAITFVMLGAGIELCRVLGNLLSNAAHVRRKTKSLTLPYAVGSMTTLVLIYFAGVRHMEISWAAIALLVGAIAMFITMLINMYVQIKFVLDVKRCFAGVIGMLIMALLSFWVPKVSGFVAAIGMLFLAATIAGITVIALLWKNPATIRLLKVSLRKI